MGRLPKRMAKITLFTIPKPFIGHNGVIQRNAIQSWLRIIPADQIYLFGDEIGISEISGEFGLTQISKIRKTSFGTPLLSDAFNEVQQIAKTDLICYINTDIILFSDFTAAANCIQKKKYLMLGRRWNFDIEQPVVFNLDWEENLRLEVINKGNLFSEFGIDYFLFPRGMIKDFPDFAVGRPGWDNWLVYSVRSKRICVIDATPEVMIIHQNHDYAHVPQAKKINSYEGPEALENRKLIGTNDYFFSVNDATHTFSKGKIIFDFSLIKIITRIGHQDVLIHNPFYLFFIKSINFVYKRFICFLTK